VNKLISIIVQRRLFYFLLAVFLGVVLLIAGVFKIPGQLIKKDREISVQGENINLSSQSPAGPDKSVSALQPQAKIDEGDTDFFIEYRIERERTRGRQIELLREIINNTDASEQARKKAQEELLVLSGKMAKETELEHLIRAKGYRDASVCIEERGVTVVLQTDNIIPEEITRICEVISWGTGVGEQNIMVIPKN
jgi:stage III sporulation protein AH